MEASPAVNGLDRATLLALVAMGLGVFVIANDFTALSVAIPEIESDLDAGLSPSGWASTPRSSSRNPSFPRGSGSPSVSTRRWPRLASSWRWRTSVAPRR